MLKGDRVGDVNGIRVTVFLMFCGGVRGFGTRVRALGLEGLCI